LIERRAIDVLKAADLGATLVEWRCRLQTPPDKDFVTLQGNFYFGLGMRFLPSMDHDGRFFNSDNAPGEPLQGARKLTTAKWCAYTAKADGKPVTVAIFDNPANLRPAKVYSMSDPFAYFSATLNTWKKPIRLTRDQPIDLCYGIALWDGEPDSPKIEALYQRWLKLCNKP
jgi:hypothetical protein